MTVQSPPAKKKTPFSDITYESAEQRLPYWARSTNPIVRRHLGLYWRTVPPEARPFITLYLVWVGIFVVGMFFPAFFGFTMISFLAAIMIIPLAFAMYGHVLLNIAISAADSMQQEMRNNTFELLRATPMSLPQIFLGKVAAAMWKRMDDIIMVGQLTIAFSPPLIFTALTGVWPLEGDGGTIITPVATMLATLVVLYRVFAEPIMIGVIAVFIGLVVPGRSRAITSAVVIGAFYFLLLNLLSQLPSVRGFEANGVVVPPNIPAIIALDFILPVILPFLISYTLLKVGERMVTADEM